MKTKITVPKQKVIEAANGDSNDEWELVEQFDWVQYYKYQHQRVILKNLSDGTFWEYTMTRSGSAFSEYHYEDYYADNVTLYQVERIEILVPAWEYVKGSHLEGQGEGL